LFLFARPLHAFLNGEAAFLELGHPNFSGNAINDGQASPSAQTFRDNYGIALAGNYVWVGDSHNQRVTGFQPFPSANFSSASILLGQADFLSAAFNGGASCGPSRFTVVPQVYAQGGHFFVCDQGNNRVLIYNSFPASQQSPDLVVGQTNFVSSWGGTSPNQLNSPSGVCYDGSRLYVVDQGNNRLLIYYSLPSSNGASADLVLGQTGFYSGSPNQGGSPGAGTLNQPFAVSSDGTRIFVSDTYNNRVLEWDSIPGGNGAAATKVLGQADFVSNLSNRGGVVDSDTLYYPYGISSGSGKLCVADPGNARVLVWNAMPVSSGAGADTVLGQSSFAVNSSGSGNNRFYGCRGVSYQGVTLAVCDSGNNRVMFFQDLAPLVSGYPDLDVALISRTPHYHRYIVQYTTLGPNLTLPYLQPGTETEKRQPDNGEVLQYVATVMNKSTVTASAYGAVWTVDGVTMASLASPGPLSPAASQSFTFSYAYNSALRHSIGFQADPAGLLTETTKANNILEIDDHALYLDLWVEQGLYDIFNQTTNLIGSQSFEDWLQSQCAAMNLRFSQAIYGGAPSGIVDRVRIDRINVVTDTDDTSSTFNNDPNIYDFDGRWSLSDRDPSNAAGISGAWQTYVSSFVDGIDWGLVHEWSHQCGLIDEYRMNLLNDPTNNNGFHVLDFSSVQIPDTALPTYAYSQIVFQYPGIMGGGNTYPWVDTTYYDDHSTLGMNRHAGQRRGYYGEFLYDVPANLSVHVQDGSGSAMAGISVELFQKDAGTEEFYNSSVCSGITDASGNFLIPNRAVTGTSTYTGHTLTANAFGQIDVVGRNGTFFIRLSRCGQVSYYFMTLSEINVDFCQGNQTSYAYVLKAPSLAGACPSASPSPTASPSCSPTPSISPSFSVTPSPSPSPSPLATFTVTPPPSGKLLKGMAVPNPVSSGSVLLAVDLDGTASGLDWKIYSAAYQLVLSGRAEEALGPGWNHVPVDLRGLAAGIYFVRVHTVGGAHDGQVLIFKPLMVLP
jgi:hypothetical protein